jgi:hypothetical protein
MPTADKNLIRHSRSAVTPPLTAVFQDPTSTHLSWTGTRDGLLLDHDRILEEECNVDRDVLDLPLHYLWRLDERKRRVDGVSGLLHIVAWIARSLHSSLDVCSGRETSVQAG